MKHENPCPHCEDDTNTCEHACFGCDEDVPNGTCDAGYCELCCESFCNEEALMKILSANKVRKDWIIKTVLFISVLAVGSTFLGLEFGWKVGWGVGLINYAMMLGFRYE